ncbi:hypothetical protein [cf. Phormidesmis sp. LEGE 11477]|uniref:hypothetical protein n=1 Tax=cf. Phormidesmis sp. LEGE 11477 TaxID=1828680 RepID=UPI00187E9067|nr:hypothetical protein [cf. Phormidesmis sp. LEGE 11477]MBE9064918.1 hypothetical protein [cf. Phormidesmis sp. LEGE 11477]
MLRESTWSAGVASAPATAIKKAIAPSQSDRLYLSGHPESIADAQRFPMYVGDKEGGFRLKKWFRDWLVALSVFSWITSSVLLLVEPFPFPLIGIVQIVIMAFGVERKPKPKAKPREAVRGPKR